MRGVRGVGLLAWVSLGARCVGREGVPNACCDFTLPTNERLFFSRLLPSWPTQSYVWSLAWSCEGNLLASGSADCSVRLWDVHGQFDSTRDADHPPTRPF